MTTGQRVAVVTILALLATCLWLAWNTIKAPARLSAGGNRGNLGITSVDLSAASAEILCFRAILPEDTGNDAQGGETTITLAFAAYDRAGTP